MAFCPEFYCCASLFCVLARVQTSSACNPKPNAKAPDYPHTLTPGNEGQAVNIKLRQHRVGQGTHGGAWDKGDRVWSEAIPVIGFKNDSASKGTSTADRRKDDSLMTTTIKGSSSENTPDR